MMSVSVRHRFKRQRLGEILLDRKLVDEVQLEEALRLQQRKPDYVGNTLIEMGFVSEYDVAIALGIQSHLPYLSIMNYEVNKEVLSLIPKEYAQRYRLMPLDKVGRVLSVVVASPLEDEIRRELSELTCSEIASFMGTGAEIDRAIAYWYD